MQFLNPNVFYMMLIPLLLLILLILTSKEMLEEYFSKQMVNKLRVGNSAFSKKGRNFLLFLSLIFFIVALARPVTDEKDHNVTQKLIPMVIALDVSKSMQAKDVYPNRIEFAKKKLKSFIKNAKNTMIGVVLFAKDSYMLSPVTEDFLSLNFIVDNLDTNVNFPNGSNIYATLDATKYMLKDFKVKNLVILTDGGNKKDYSNELDFAKENHINIYAIGIGTKKGAAIPDGKNGYLTNKNGDIVTVKRNDSIKELTKQSGGGYIEYTLDNSDVKAILERINMQSKKETLSKQNIKTYTELFYYPLALGIFFLFLALSSLPKLKRAKSVAMIITVLFFSSFHNNANAYELDFEKIEKAKELYNKKQYNKAADEYRAIRTTPQSLYNLGNSLYKEKKYDDAIKAYSKIITKDRDLEEKKLHNIGNSYVEKNQLEKAKEFYEKALKAKFDKETKENLDIVKKALEKKKKQQQKNNKDQKNDKKNSKDQKDQKDQKKNEKQKDQKNGKNGNKDQQNKDHKDDKQKSGQKNKDQKNNKEKDKDKKQQNSDKNKQQNSQDQKEKNKDQKNKQKENQDTGTKEDQKKKQNEKQKQMGIAKKEDKKKDKTAVQNGQLGQSKPEQISQLEEDKWMKRLQNNNKSPILIQRVPSQHQGDTDESQPW